MVDFSPIARASTYLCVVFFSYSLVFNFPGIAIQPFKLEFHILFKEKNFIPASMDDVKH